MINKAPKAKIIACATNDSIIELSNRPQGNGVFTFTHFLSNVAVKLDDTRHKVHPGDCLIHAGNHPHEYQGEENTWDSDWCVFDGTGMQMLIDVLGLPINQIFRPDSTHFVAPLLEKISIEHEHQSNRWEMVVSLGLQELLVKLSRHWIKGRTKSNGNGSADPLEKMQEVRAIVHDQLGIQWRGSDMAKMCNLSESRFAFLYKKCFEVSPMEDLISKRIRHASILLSDTHRSIAEVAEESGFEDLQYFYRAFKKRIGTTPKNLRKRNSASSPWRAYDEERGKLEAIWASSDFHGMIGPDEEGIPFIQAISGDWSNLGWSRKEILEQPLLGLIHLEDSSLVKKASSTVKSGGLLRDLSLRTLCKNGSYCKIAWTGAASNDTFYFSANFGQGA